MTDFEYPVWRIPNTSYTLRGAADMFAAEYFTGRREVVDFNDEDMTFKLKNGTMTYRIESTSKWINVYRS